MTATPMISNVAARDQLNALTALLNSGHVKVFTGSMPSTCETADSGTTLVTFALANPAFGAATDGSDGTAHAALSAALSATAGAGSSSAAGYARGYDSSGNCVIQGNVGTSSADFIISVNSITSGDLVALTAWNLKQPDGSGSD